MRRRGTDPRASWGEAIESNATARVELVNRCVIRASGVSLAMFVLFGAPSLQAQEAPGTPQSEFSLEQELPEPFQSGDEDPLRPWRGAFRRRSASGRLDPDLQHHSAARRRSNGAPPPPRGRRSGHEPRVSRARPLGSVLGRSGLERTTGGLGDLSHAAQRQRGEPDQEDVRDEVADAQASGNTRWAPQWGVPRAFPPGPDRAVPDQERM